MRRCPGSHRHQADGLVAACAAELLARIVAMREELPKAANGHPMAPSEPYVEQVLKDWGQDKSRAVHQCVAVLLCNVRDGGNFRPVIDLLTAMLAAEERRREEKVARRAGSNLKVLSRQEQRIDAVMDGVQMLVHENDEDPAVLEALSRAAQADIAITTKLKQEADAKIVAIRTAPAAIPSPRALRDARSARRAPARLHVIA